MISSEVQRTLVKSPPELWAELSDQAALAKHLSDLEGIGEIRITKIEPETLVEWEAEAATGSVAIKASGWGTKVTLRVSRELPEAEAEVAAMAEPEAKPETEAVVEPEAEAAPKPEVKPEGEPEAAAIAEPKVKAEAVVEPKPAPEAEAAPEVKPESGPNTRPLTAAERFAPEFPPSLRGEQLQAEPAEEPGRVEALAPQPEPEPIKRRGFFARLFGWGTLKGTGEPQAEPEQAVEPPPAPTPQAEEPQPAEPQAQEPAEEDPAAEEPQAPEPQAQEPEAAPDRPDLAAELLAAEEQVTAVLTAVLDRLGSAHHRPFSRA